MTSLINKETVIRVSPLWDFRLQRKSISQGINYFLPFIQKSCSNEGSGKKKGTLFFTTVIINF